MISRRRSVTNVSFLGRAYNFVLKPVYLKELNLNRVVEGPMMVLLGWRSKMKTSASMRDINFCHRTVHLMNSLPGFLEDHVHVA